MPGTQARHTGKATTAVVRRRIRRRKTRKPDASNAKPDGPKINLQAERKFVEEIVGQAINAQHVGISRGKEGRELACQMQELVFGVFHVDEVLCVFRRYPPGTAVEEIAKFLDVSRPGLHFRMKKLGLAASQFKNASLQQLIEQSDVLASLLAIAKDCDKLAVSGHSP